MRVLLVGGGCRALHLTRELVARGDAVRAVTRDESRREQIESAGAECWIGDPAVIGTLRYALENVTILVWALGTAAGTDEQVAALHGSRLEMMLSKTIDTTVRGVIYEATGTIAAELLAGGGQRLSRVCTLHEIPFALLAGPQDGADAWAAAVLRAIDRMLGVG